MSAVQFCQNPIVAGGSIAEPQSDVIEASLNLRQASLADAARYGGPIMREALDALDLIGDRQHVVVDTKVNFLLPGFVPAIPGWHTDGVPRVVGDGTFNPAASGDPHLGAQIDGLISTPRYHLLVTGTHAPTEFIADPITLDLPTNRPYRGLYEDMTKVVDERLARGLSEAAPTPSCTWVRWDWWSIHRAVPAIDRGWRYLIRVTETDHIPPREGPSNFIRSQSQVYVPTAFGW